MNATPIRHELTTQEQELLASFQRRLQEAQAMITQQYIGALQAIVTLRERPQVPGSYRLIEDGKALVGATP